MALAGCAIFGDGDPEESNPSIRDSEKVEDLYY
jgi:hypothetical protein